MEVSEHYQGDLLAFFAGKAVERALYETLIAYMDKEMPESSVKVQKSQISFYRRHLFAAVSLPMRRKKDWPEQCLVLTLGLSRPLESLRVAVKVEPYPGRWTNHILLSKAEDLDEELMGWMKEAYDFALLKSRRRTPTVS